MDAPQHWRHPPNCISIAPTAKSPDRTDYIRSFNLRPPIKPPAPAGKESSGSKMAPPSDPASSVPENLYHTTLTIIDHHASTSGATRTPYVLGTHTDLDSAKTWAQVALQESLNYSPSDFTKFVARTSLRPYQEWPYGENIQVYALSPSGQEFLVGIVTKPNEDKLPHHFHAEEGADATTAPQHKTDTCCGHDDLHYILQTKWDFKQAKGDKNSTAFQRTELAGCCVPRKEAFQKAKSLLRGERDRGMFAQYDERDTGDEESEIDERRWGRGSGWPFGEEVVVHAVGHGGENYEVAVKSVSGARRRRSKPSLEMGETEH
ncbi:hypothetical protein QBC41DRAFT_362737 [Cercophora samala]|uniref:Uncharacterized protein n=1 Tax=Cercophora samala TaxID=330535 RepID=A0AA40DFB7_9PEZI|nr:hypothetical protein QBC41DRAFT_362737 [Cercophora samala]